MSSVLHVVVVLDLLAVIKSLPMLMYNHHLLLGLAVVPG